LSCSGRGRSGRRRTEDGSEVDLLLERGGQVEAAIEITRSTAPAPSRGFHLACETLKPRAAYLVHGGDGTWPAAKGIAATSLTDLMTLLSGGGRSRR
jgi:hypothetical protein